MRARILANDGCSARSISAGGDSLESMLNSSPIVDHH